MYRSGKENAKADALTRKPDEIDSQNAIKRDFRTRALLSKDQVEMQALRNLGIEIDEITLAPVETYEFDESLTISERIRKANKTALSLEPLRKQALQDDSAYTIEEDLVLFRGCLIVLDTDTLRTDLIREAYD